MSKPKRKCAGQAMPEVAWQGKKTRLEWLWTGLGEKLRALNGILRAKGPVAMLKKRLETINYLSNRLKKNIKDEMLNEKEPVRQYWAGVISFLEAKQAEAEKKAVEWERSGFSRKAGLKNEACRAIEDLELAYLGIKEKLLDEPSGQARHIPPENGKNTRLR